MDGIAHIETDVRERILVTAERLFREIGYRKTAVADIAKALRMSSADTTVSLNSKKSINEDVAHRSCGKWKRRSYRHAPTTTERLHELAETVHLGPLRRRFKDVSARHTQTASLA
jgi:AcrR family transcriptional regulator